MSAPGATNFAPAMSEFGSDSAIALARGHFSFCLKAVVTYTPGMIRPSVMVRCSAIECGSVSSSPLTRDRRFVSNQG